MFAKEALSKIRLEHHPTPSAAIHPFPPPWSQIKSLNRYKCIVFTTIHFFCYEKPSPTSPAANPSPNRPVWYRLPNWEDGLLEPVLKRFSASSCFPSSAKTSQMGVSSPATPKYKTSRPKIPPNVRNSERNPPPATSGIVVIYLLVPPTPAQHPRPTTHPRPPIRHPRHINHLPAHPKNPICHPNEPRLPGIYPGLHCFLGGGVSPIYIDHVCWAEPQY
jgi:hypothetical protein